MAASHGSLAQDSFIEDTLNIPAITVTAKAADRLTPFTVVKMDQELLAQYRDGDLATMLQSASSLYVRRNGNQGLASVSIRGMSGSHTLVTWNGLPVNSPGNGYSDFTLIPMLAASSVRITSGGSDLDDINGYIGGKVELATDPVFDSGTQASLSLGAGSYSEYSSSLSATYGGTVFYGSLGAWAEKGLNDFRFLNSDAPGGPAKERRSNASFHSAGLKSDLAWRSRQSQISTHLWFNDSDRQLPGPVTTVQQDFGERQTDRSFRGVIKYSGASGKLSTGVMAGGSHDLNRYYHMVPSNNGDNSSSAMMVKVRLGYRITEKTALALNAGDVMERASALSYDSKEKRNTFSVSLAAKSNPVPRLSLLLQARQMAVTGMKVSPEITAGASWLLTRNGEHLLKASISRNTKLPCLNDLFWVPGGNPDLLPEKSAGGEVSWSFAGATTPEVRNTVDLTVHASRVDDLIQWIPGQTGLWHAVNLRSVSVSGLDARAGREQPLGEWKLKGWLTYALTRSVISGSDIPNDRSVGSQLIYAPLHHANLNLMASRGWFRAAMSAAWESRRYTTSDNSEWLPSDLMSSASAGAVFPAGPVILKTEIKVNNITGTPVESVRNYPMPLRTFNLKITLTWSDKTEENEQTP
ncbi:MAG: TonB-dependent receptor plug domain-containing protein [Bacteroidota bacterium]|nr:TonB-dependent receptor plug domain-containing protein [Bacteroidota bacterium]